MKKPELLAPAGDLESGYAALHYGADAVYLGLKSFSARASATNFTPEELNEFTAYAHHLNKKVYVTINTIIQEHELNNLTKTLDICSNCQIDGVILQDLGVAHIIRQYYPELPLHASTQMAVHNVEGALALKQMGFSRVVLARELTLDEIQKIASIPDLETESFIHGALCYAYSGLCLFSSMDTGHSANRGKCAYPCRALFQRGEKSGHFFSMKDMALGENILKLPVTSLKIEGRKKKPLYVAAVVDYYRQILDTGHADSQKANNIKQIFSRPWTTFHVLGKNSDIIDPDFVGHRGLTIGQVDCVIQQQLKFTPKHTICRYDGLQIDLPGQEKPFGFSIQNITIQGRSVFTAKAGQSVKIELPPHSPFIPPKATVYLASSTLVKGSYDYIKPKPHAYKIRPIIPVSISLDKDQIIATANDIQITEQGPFEAAKNLQKMNQSVQDVFQKYQDTDFQPEIHIQNSGVFVPISTLNQIRRKLYAKIQPHQKHVELPNNNLQHPISTPKWLIKTDEIQNLISVDTKSFEEILIQISPDMNIDLLKSFPKRKVRLCLPTVCRNTEQYIPIIQQLCQNGFHKWEIGNLWGLSVLPPNGIDLTFDSSLYMLNSNAIQMAQELGVNRITLSVEDNLNNLSQIALHSPLATTLIVYQDIPLFTSANCIKNTCAHCHKETCFMPLKKENNTYQAKIKNCTLTLFSDKAFYIASEREQIHPDFYRMDFINRPYTSEQIQTLITKIQNAEKINSTFSGNLKREI